MRASSASRRLAATMFAAAIAATISLPVTAQTNGAKESYNAIAVNMGSGPTGAGRVLITVDRWSTAAERERHTKISLSKDKKTIELENYGTEPVRPTEVTIEKK